MMYNIMIVVFQLCAIATAISMSLMFITWTTNEACKAVIKMIQRFQKKHTLSKFKLTAFNAKIVDVKEDIQHLKEQVNSIIDYLDGYKHDK